MEIREITEKIRRGEIDCNNQSRFLSILSKGLLAELRDNVAVRDVPVPHYIPNTGDEIMMLEVKGQDHSKEPLETVNENYIYTIIPRCVVTPKGINMVLDQLSNPYTTGRFQYESDDEVVTFVSEFRRIPMNVSFELIYLVDSYNDFLEIVQQVITKMAFVRTFNITYMGQQIRCSYNIPDSLDGEHMLDFDEATTDDRRRKMSFDITVETCIPVFDNRTVIPADNYIKHTQFNLDGYGKEGIADKGPHEELNNNHETD